MATEHINRPVGTTSMTNLEFSTGNCLESLNPSIPTAEHFGKKMLSDNFKGAVVDALSTLASLS